MKIGIGVDASLRLSFDEEAELVGKAASLGYESAWTPSGSAVHDGFQTCASWARATAEHPSFSLGVAVIPAPVWTVPSLVSQAGSVGALSGGRFILGMGTGGIYTPAFRKTYGLPDWPTVGMMRDYTVTTRALLRGEQVTHDGKAVTLNGLRMAGQPLNVPVYLAALGAQMLRLSGEAADGVCLNWTTPAHREWCRERIAEGAAKADRDPGEVVLMEYIRVCIDEDEGRARRAFAKAFMGYALARPGTSTKLGYRGHFGRQGFDETLTAIEAKQEAGATPDELADAFPEEFLKQMGYYGPAAGAPAALRELSRGLDVAVVRIVGSEPGMSSAMTTVEACQPSLIG